MTNFSTALKAQYENSPKNGESISLAFVGDVCLGAGVAEVMRSHGPDYPFREVATLLRRADLTIGNLECWISEGETTPNRMAVAPAFAAGLASSGLSAMSLANNHIMDGGEQGLGSTNRVLDKLGIGHFGAGINLSTAAAPLVTAVGGIRIGIIGACDVAKIYARPGSAGIAPLNWRRLSEQVSSLKRNVDLTIVCIHADMEFSHYPSPARIRGSRRLVEAGADLVIQHHPHVCQGVEAYHGGLIAYSLGNFVFNVQDNPYMRNRAGCDWGAILFVDVKGSAPNRELSWKLLPVTIDSDHRPVPSIGLARERQLQELDRFSRGLSDKEFIRASWHKRCLVEAKVTAYSAFNQARRSGLSSAVRDTLGLLRLPHERRWLYGLLTNGRMG